MFFMKKSFLPMIMLVVLAQQVFSQKQIETREQTWLGYFNQTRLTDKSGIWLDLHARLNDNFINEKALAMGRVGYIYYLSDQVRLATGYAFVMHYAHGGGPNVPEHRPWQQIQWFDKKKGFNLMQW